MRKITLLIIFFIVQIFIVDLCVAQNQHKIDSFLNVLKTAKEDTNKANLLNKLASAYTFIDPQKSFEYSSNALLLAQKLNSKNFIIQSYQNISSYYGNTGNFKAAIEYIKKSIPLIEEIGNKVYLSDAYGNLSTMAYYTNDYYGAFAYSEKALQLAQEINDSTKIAVWLNTIGCNYRDITADYNTALSYLFRSLNINKERNDKNRICYDYYNIGIIYSLESNFDKALQYFNEALKSANESDNQQLVEESLNQIGYIYYARNDLTKAEEYYTQAMNKNKKTNFFGTLIQSDDGLAKVYIQSGKFDKAIEHLKHALQIAGQSGDKDAIARIYGSFSDMYIKMKNYKTANDYLIKTLLIANEIGRKDLLKEVYHRLSENNKLINNYKSAYEYQNEYIKINDSITGENILKKTAELQVKYETEKKDKEILSLTKDKQIQNIEIARQKLIKNSLIGGLAALLLISVLFYNYYRTKQLLRLQTLRNNIASDLHDDVGSTLSSIAIFSELAKQQSKEVIPMLESISDSSRKMLESMADIVWTINPENDNFEKIILRMRSFAYELLGAKKIDFEFNADDTVAKMKLPMDVRKNLYLIFKEAINNMVKYADADRAFFSISGTKNDLAMLIRDNGKGFDINTSSEGNGLKNMKKRAQEIGAQLFIESGAGIGTTIQFLLKAS